VVDIFEGQTTNADVSGFPHFFELSPESGVSVCLNQVTSIFSPFDSQSYPRHLSSNVRWLLRDVPQLKSERVNNSLAKPIATIEPAFLSI